MEISSKFSGLPNLGNTCYIASSLQCLFHIPRIFTYFSTISFKDSESENMKSETLHSLMGLFKEIISETSFDKKIFELFLTAFKDFCDGTQQDAQEFLKILLERIHDLTNRGNPKLPFKEFKYQMNKDDTIQQKLQWSIFRERDNSIITETFCGQFANSLICESCKNKTKSFEDFWDISLSFRDTSHKFDRNNKKTAYFLGEMIENYLKSEEINDRPCSKCENSKKTRKTLEITRFPNILILHLKRFYYKEFRKEKLSYFVKFPVKNLSFSISKGVGKSVMTNYNLIGIIHHLGDLEHGHYYSECLDHENKEWFQYNDDHVDYIKMVEEEYSKKGSDTAYILFYEKNR